MMKEPDKSAERKPATPATAAINRAWRDRLPFHDRADYAAAKRGFIAAFDGDKIVRQADGQVVWDFKAYSFLEAEEEPDTVNPSLWRQAQLNYVSGLYQVCERVYQIRGYDISNMDIIEGDTGLIVIDPLISTEVAAAGLETYYRHRPRRPVVAVIYTHSHVDHFGGVRGVVDEADVRAGRVSIWAPDKFMEETVSENVLAGPAMYRRVQYQFGTPLPTGPRAQVDCGLGKALSSGTVTLIAPTHTIVEAVETHVVDGVEIEFMLTPGTEAPAEMHMYFPQFRALCAAENACHCMHNVLTIRGALVRDPRIWSHYLDVTLERYGERSDVMFTQHHWPVWGKQAIRSVLEGQRDMYAFLNDETLRLMNHGLTPTEISNRILSLPDPVGKAWFARDYYGTVSHNVRAVYQRYLGFYDANPAHLNPLGPVAVAKRTVEWMGGADAVLAKARTAFQAGDYRWVVQIVNEVVFADPENRAAKLLQADALEQLGYQCESAIWRNAYLTGAQELREGVKVTTNIMSPADLVRALTPEMFFAFLAVRLDSGKAAAHPMKFNWRFPDLGRDFALTVQSGVLTHRPDRSHADPVATVTMDKATLDRIGMHELTIQQAVQDGLMKIAGDGTQIAQFFAMLDAFEDKFFNIVTPPVWK